MHQRSKFLKAVVGRSLGTNGSQEEALGTLICFWEEEVHTSEHCLTDWGERRKKYRVTQKSGTFEKPNKN